MSEVPGQTEASSDATQNGAQSLTQQIKNRLAELGLADAQSLTDGLLLQADKLVWFEENGMSPVVPPNYETFNATNYADNSGKLKEGKVKLLYEKIQIQNRIKQIQVAPITDIDKFY